MFKKIMIFFIHLILFLRRYGKIKKENGMSLASAIISYSHIKEPRHRDRLGRLTLHAAFSSRLSAFGIRKIPFAESSELRADSSNSGLALSFLILFQPYHNANTHRHLPTTFSFIIVSVNVRNSHNL